MKRRLWRHDAGFMLAMLMGMLLLQPVTSPQAAAPVGEVVVYSARIEALIKPMFDAFTEKTGIQVKYFTAGEKELFERLQSEGANTPADIFMTVERRQSLDSRARRPAPELQLRGGRKEHP